VYPIHSEKNVEENLAFFLIIFPLSMWIV